MSVVLSMTSEADSPFGESELQLAELVNIDRSHISAIELGNVGVSMDVIFKMAEVLEISPKDLFDFRD